MITCSMPFLKLASTLGTITGRISKGEISKESVKNTNPEINVDLVNELSTSCSLAKTKVL